LNSDQIAWKDKAKDALSASKKRKFFQAFYRVGNNIIPGG
jgi:hypothetical protein